MKALFHAQRGFIALMILLFAVAIGTCNGQNTFKLTKVDPGMTYTTDASGNIKTSKVFFATKEEAINFFGLRVTSAKLFYLDKEYTLYERVTSKSRSLCIVKPRKDGGFDVYKIPSVTE